MKTAANICEGQWGEDPLRTRIWFPSLEWGPAWAAWRADGSSIGAVPLAPAGVMIALGAPQQIHNVHPRSGPLFERAGHCEGESPWIEGQGVFGRESGTGTQTRQVCATGAG